MYGMWTKRQETWKEYGSVVRACRDAMRKMDKVHLFYEERLRKMGLFILEKKLI